MAALNRFPIAFIPFTSLFYLEEQVHDRLDGHIYRLVAHHNPISSPEKLQPFPWMTIRKATSLYVSIHYHHKHHFYKEPFRLMEAVHASEEAGAFDLWIDELGLQFDGYVNQFKNRPSTPGSKVEEMVVRRWNNWLKKRKIEVGLERFKPNRHLEFVKAVNPQTKTWLDEYTVYTEGFIRGLNRSSYGVIEGKIVERVGRVGLRDVEVIEF
ncbi:MAG: hypothetical protein QW587_04665 [Candidatus Bathyarchaeia archaeon]